MRETEDDDFDKLRRCLRAVGASDAPTQYSRPSQKNSHPLLMDTPLACFAKDQGGVRQKKASEPKRRGQL